MIEHNRPWITLQDRAAVDAVLVSGWIAQGPVTEALEAAFVAMHGGGSACAVSSGTAALALALRAAGVAAGMSVGVPSYSCSALLNAIQWVGARPAVGDVLEGRFTLDCDTLERPVDAVVAVHAFGAPACIADCRKIAPIVIEDCCQSLGGEVGGRPLGETGDVAVYSFYATKIVCGGQGGLVWSSHESLVEGVRDYRQFDGRETYEPRFNLQLTDMQAALALSQMQRLALIRQRRTSLAQRYREAMPTGWACQDGLQDPGCMPQRYVVVAPEQGVRDALARHMESAGVRCIVPVERFELLHRYLELDPQRYPVSEHLADTTLSLPLYPALTEAQADQVCAALRGFRP